MAGPVLVLILVLPSKLMCASNEKVVRPLIGGPPSYLHVQERHIGPGEGVCPWMVHAETCRVLRNDGWVVGARLLAPRHPPVSLQLVADLSVAGADLVWPWVAVVDVAESSLAVAICPLGR